MQRGSVFIDKEEQDRLLLAEHMVEFYKDFDYYDYRDKTEISDTIEDQIISMSEDLKDQSSVMSAAAWLEVAVSEFQQPLFYFTLGQYNLNSVRKSSRSISRHGL